MQHNLFYFDSQAVKLIETPIERSSHLTGFAASVQEMDVSVDYTSASSSDLYTFSPKMLIMAQHILRAPKFKHLVYSDKLVFDGVDYMGYVLEEQGYEEFTIAKLLRKTEKPLDLRKRYFIKYTGEQSIEDRNALLAIYNLRSARDVATLQSTAERPIRNYVEVFLKDRAKALGKNLNERYNIFGDIIHVFMTTSAGSTGLDLKNTRYVHIMEPYWQFVRMEQTIGRARRICSHVDLPKKEWRVQVYFYLTIFNKAEKQFDKSIDWKMLYNVAARKKDLSDNFLRIMQSSAIDCKLHAHDNKLCFDYGSKENMNPAIESYVPDGNQPYVTEPAFVQGALLRQRNAQGQEIRVYDLSRYVSAASYADWQNGKTRPMTQEDVRYVASQLPKLRQTEAGTVRQFPAPERQRVDEEEKDVEEAEVYAIDEEETKDKEESKVTLLSASSSSGSSSDPIVIDESVDKSAPASPAALDIPVPSYPGPPTVRAETPFAPELFLLQRVPASVRAIVKNMIDNVDVIAPSFHAELTLPYASFLLPTSILNQKYWSSPDRAGLRVHVIAPNLATLTPNTCTENEILNGTLAYMKILHARKDVLILDSAFYSTLRPSSAQGTLNLEANSVARAARYIDVSQYRLILVPVHGAAHWSLGAIWPQMNEVTYYDSLGSAAKHSTVCDDLRLWYQDRMRKQNQSGNFVLTTRPVPRALIRQDNLDCGLYMLFFAEMLMLQQEARLETPQPGDSAWVSQHMPLVRELIAYLFMQYRVDQEMVWNKPASPSASAPRSRKRVASPGEQTATSMKKSKKQGGTRKISRH